MEASAMKLQKYRVTNFRSVKDSGWIDCDNITTLVGVNESGKSNLLLALWKLNPAREGKIDILHDMPVSKLSTLRTEPEKTKFIEACFELDQTSATSISNTTGCPYISGMLVYVSRFYDGHYTISIVDKNGDQTLQPKTDDFDPEVFEKAIMTELPKFVYYSNYGNLSSKIYLPHVTKWINGEKVPGFDPNEEQIRTLRVLFDFVKLDPQEILNLGKDPKDIAKERNRGSITPPTQDDIKKAEENKEHRSILLQSASVSLTKQFKEWWMQGEYKFRFEADGDYFRIWVSDNVRTDEVGLELRSTGLQWFLSFYLIFLVESQAQHKNAILLLDEAGLTLHPMAQKDLSKFFDKLSEHNQIINTTHSPFIVDPTNIDQCRVVYMDTNGFTIASSNLRQGADSVNERSIYAIHAAMGLCVSDILFQGCCPIIVEGPSDQFYLNAIKSFLIKEKIIAPKQELIFIPSGGVKGVSGIVSLLASKNSQFPFVLLDSDRSGSEAKKKLSSNLYSACKDRLLEVKDFLAMEQSEVEDLIPFSLQKRAINKMFIDVEDESFEDTYKQEPIVPQIEHFATRTETLLAPGWKVELAKSAKHILASKTIEDIPTKYVDSWKSLFEKFEN